MAEIGESDEALEPRDVQRYHASSTAACVRCGVPRGNRAFGAAMSPP
jgi:hypothetical protein